MRILIITYPRSGGYSLSSWISSELGFKHLHEPFSSRHENLIKYLDDDNIVVKEFLFRIDNEFISKFDKIIIHKRLNVKDVAISWVYSDNKTGDFKNHKVYELNDEWINQHHDEVLKMESWIIELSKKLDELNINALRTTYENLFIDKDDIDKVKEYLDMEDLKYLDLLDSKRRLRNGNIGMEYIKRRRDTLI
jgi:hypothetical protein